MYISNWSEMKVQADEQIMFQRIGGSYKYTFNPANILS